MPFARHLYEQWMKTFGFQSFWKWETLTAAEQKTWEDYARCVAAYFVP
jgi:hypothetical protein